MNAERTVLQNADELERLYREHFTPNPDAVKTVGSVSEQFEIYTAFEDCPPGIMTDSTSDTRKVESNAELG